MAESVVDKRLRSLPTKTWTEFLADHPPGSPVVVPDALEVMNPGWILVTTPPVKLYCPNASCDNVMFFDCTTQRPTIQNNEELRIYLVYNCRHCQQLRKVISVQLFWPSNVPGLPIQTRVLAYKFGEIPPFGPTTPSRLLAMVGPDGELFRQGRRSECQGLGIGAFTYYRRVLDNQWGRIVQQIIRVAKRLGASEEAIGVLERAGAEQQFSKAVESVKDAIPPSLLIDGCNPLKLLYGSLSQGVHELSDAECLALATSVRHVLAELADRLTEVLKDESVLKDAVSKLLEGKARKKET